MTLFDLVVLLLIAVYAILGYFTGVIQRVIGLVGLYIGCVVATFMGVQGGSIVQQYSPNTSVPDSRLIAFLFFLFFFLLLVEGAATAVHNQIQLSVIMLNRSTGVLVGLLTAALLTVVLVYVLAGYAQPLGSGAVDDLQIKVRDSVAKSQIGLPLAKALSPTLIVFDAVLPRDPKTYFGVSVAGG